MAELAVDVEALRRALKAAADGALELIEDWATSHCTFDFDADCAEGGPFNSAAFDHLIHFIGSAPGSIDMGPVLLVFEYDWAHLTKQQKDALKQVLVRRFGEFQEEHSQFVCCELLGRFFADGDALRQLEKFSSSDYDEPHRLAAVVGLGQMVANSDSSELVTQALGLLRKLGEDPSESVRIEAREAFGN